MVIRRSVEPTIVQTIWDGVQYISHQRQMVNITRLSRYVQRVKSIPINQAEIFIEDCLRDELLRLATRKGQSDSIQQSYKTPSADTNPIDDGHDWYCFECHLAGDVICCQSCYRVYHSKCNKKITGVSISKNNKDKISNDLFVNISEQKASSENYANEIKPIEYEKENRNPVKKHGETDEKVSNNESSIAECAQKKSNTSDQDKNENHTSKITLLECKGNEKSTNNHHHQDYMPICKACQILSDDTEIILEPEELNYLFIFIMGRIRNWLPSDVTLPIITPDDDPGNLEVDNEWRQKYLLYKPLNIKNIESKVNEQKYKKLSELHIDVLSIYHNVAIYHGMGSTEVQAAEYMLTDALHDINDIRQCVDCYRLSNGTRNKRWFCIPCRPPHELVWAKQKGFCYWPAKVIRRLDGQYDVRFFGAKYVRAIIDDCYVRPIDTDISVLQVKRSSAFNKALEELKIHRDWLKNPEKSEKHLFFQQKSLVKSVELYNTTNTKQEKISNKKMPKKHTNKNDNADVYEFHDSPSESNFNNSINVSNLRTVDKRKYQVNVVLTKCDDFEDLIPLKKLKSPDLVKTSTSKLTKDNTESVIETESKKISAMETNKSNITSCIDNFDSTSQSGQDDVISSSQDVLSPVVIHSGKTGDLAQSSLSSLTNMPIPSLNRHYSDVCEKLRRQLESCNDKSQIILLACEALQDQIDCYTKKIHSIKEVNDVQISELKKKPWCYNCEQEAIYYCCWNTSYCSTKCQQEHWQAEHKKTCRRKQFLEVSRTSFS